MTSADFRAFCFVVSLLGAPICVGSLYGTTYGVLAFFVMLFIALLRK